MKVIDYVMIFANIIVWSYIVYIVFNGVPSTLKQKLEPKVVELDIDCSQCNWNLTPNCTLPDGSPDPTCDKATAYACTGSRNPNIPKSTSTGLCSPMVCPTWPPKGCEDGNEVGVCTYVPPGEFSTRTTYMGKKSDCLEYPCQTITQEDMKGGTFKEVCPTFTAYGWLRI